MVRIRPRTKLKLKRKTRRCPKCGAKLNNQRIRCKRCAAETTLIGIAPGTRKGRWVKAFRRRRKRPLDGG
jgi:predicted amidophosphoribosyltransferase